jgi:predicted nucleotidyltransferase
MRRRSLQSVEKFYQGRDVRVFRLDQEGVIARLRARAQSLLERNPDVLEVRLFGSLARGEAHPGSDADLFIVVRDSGRSSFDRIPDLARHFSGTGIGCDVIVYSDSERAALAAREDAFSRAVLVEGVSLACRAAC